MLDVFLAHNSADKPLIEELWQEFRNRKFEVFYDDEDMPADRLTNDVIEEKIAEALVVVLCWGEQGEGPVHRLEIDQAFNRFMHEGKSIVTVLLPGAKDVRPQRFRGFPAIIFKNAMHETKPLRKIENAINGQRAARQAEEERENGKDDEDSGVRQQPVLQQPSQREDAIYALSRPALENGINFVIGPFTGVEPPGDDDSDTDGKAGVPSPQDIAFTLARSFYHAEEGSDLTPLPLEIIASWRSLQRSKGMVEDEVRSILLQSNSAYVGFYRDFARLMRVMTDKIGSGRRMKDRRPMIFTTNFGTYLERELFRAGVSFSRIVVSLPDGLDVRRFRMTEDQTGKRVEIHDLSKDNERSLGTFRKDDADAALEAIEDEAHIDLVPYKPSAVSDSEHDEARHLSFDDMEGCILFKYHGSIDVSKSCILTSEQLFELTRAPGIVPNAVINRLEKHHPSVVFGYSMLATGVQQVLVSVLTEAFGQQMDERYLVPRKRGLLSARAHDGWIHQIEAQIHDNNRKNTILSLLEIEGGQRAFVKDLIEAVEGR
ncbi:MAG: TIR domain-containing protein [Alphaproteobacteria bacterium]|nr:TIR domain-containing protein [Alphaproteobacteria bacterium]